MSAMGFMIVWLEPLVETEMVATLVTVQVGTQEMEDCHGSHKDV